MVRIYKVIGRNSLFDILGTTLENRGIEDTDRFLNPSQEDEIHYSNLKNMDRAVEMFDKHKKNGSKAAVIVDNDADGFTSSSEIVQYARKNTPELEIDYYLHEKRENGLTEDMMTHIQRDLPDFVILPDASSNDHEQHKVLQDMGIDILVLDHHIIEDNKESEYAVVVNPQLCLDTYPNGQLAAGGIVYKFLQALDDKYGFNDADNYLDLVAVSSVADAMDICVPETRYYVYKGLRNITNPFLKELIKRNADWVDEVYPKIVSFNMANFMNAVIRVGDIEEKTTIFRALLGEKDVTTRISRYRGVEREVTETLAETAYRLCSNARGRQNRRKNKLVEEAVNYVEEYNLNKNPVIVVELEDVPSGFAGLTAMSIAGMYKKPAVVVTWSEEKQLYMGSLRGYEGGAVKNTKEYLESLEVFETLQGHNNAAGATITKEGMKRLREILKVEKLHFSQEDSSIPVDFLITPHSLSKSLAEEFDRLAFLWGTGCKEPVVAIKDLEIRSDNIKTSSILKAFVGDVELISFTVDPELAKAAEETGKVITVDVVGSLGLNRFMDKATPQFIMNDVKIKNIKDESFEFLF